MTRTVYLHIFDRQVLAVGLHSEADATEDGDPGGQATSNTESTSQTAGFIPPGLGTYRESTDHAQRRH